MNSGQLNESDVDTVLLNMGQPLLEVFLRRDEATGRLRSCATAIVPTDPTQASPNIDMLTGFEAAKLWSIAHTEGNMQQSNGVDPRTLQDYPTEHCFPQQSIH